MMEDSISFINLANEMAQWVKRLAAKANEFILRTHMAEEKNWVLQAVLWLPHVHYVLCMRTDIDIEM